MVVACQIDDQLLKTTPRNKETTALLDPSHHIEGGEILDPASIRDKLVAEGLEVQDNMSVPVPVTN